MDEPPLDLFDGLTGELAERLIREELPETALFGLRFRQNAARALLDAPPRSGQANAALAPAAPRQGLAAGRAAVSRLSDRARDRARVPRRRPRPAAAAVRLLDAIAGGPVRVVSRARRDPVAVRVGADLPVHGGPPVRVGRAEAERPPARSARSSTKTCSSRCCAAAPRTTGSIPRRSAGSRIGCGAWAGRRARADEMAEHLRLLGDLTPRKSAGPDGRPSWPSCEPAGRARADRACRGPREPSRWILAEEEIALSRGVSRRTIAAITKRCGRSSGDSCRLTP